MIDIVEYDPDGDALKAHVSGDHEQPGSYTLFQWKANENVILLERKGNFINRQDDTHDLVPGSHDGQVIEALVTCVVLPGVQRFGAHLRILQGDVEIGHVAEGGPAAPGTKTADLFCQLAARTSGDPGGTS